MHLAQEDPLCFGLQEKIASSIREGAKRAIKEKGGEPQSRGARRLSCLSRFCFGRGVDSSTYCDYALEFIIHIHGLRLSPVHSIFLMQVTNSHCLHRPKRQPFGFAVLWAQIRGGIGALGILCCVSVIGTHFTKSFSKCKIRSSSSLSLF